MRKMPLSTSEDSMYLFLAGAKKPLKDLLNADSVDGPRRLVLLGCGNAL